MTERCQHCGGSVLYEREIDSKAIVGTCMTCGRTARAQKEEKVPEFSVKPATNGAAAKPQTTTAAKVLEAFTQAAGLFVSVSEEHKAATEKLARLTIQLETARKGYAEARAKLDQELGTLGAAPAPKPSSGSRVGIARPRANLPEKACAVCGTMFQPDRQTHLYCSRACNQKAVTMREAEAKRQRDAMRLSTLVEATA